MDFSDKETEPAPMVLISDTAAHNSSQGFAEIKITDSFEVVTDAHYNKSINGEWEFGLEIGEGSFSKTKIVTRESDDRKDALKIYNKICLETKRKLIYATMEWSNNLVNVQEEIDIWTRLSSPYIPQIYEIFEKQAWHKLYVRNELGDLGVPGTFDYDERTFKLKKSVFTIYTNKILQEQESLKANFSFIEHKPSLNINHVPETHFNPALKVLPQTKPFSTHEDSITPESLNSMWEGKEIKKLK